MNIVNEILGLQVERLGAEQMAARAILVFFIALSFIRIAGLRTLGKQTIFDQLTVIILGAILGRAIVSADLPFFPSLGAVLVIMLLHRLLAWLTFKSKTLGKLCKGVPVPLFENGNLNVENLRATRSTQEDIQESLHLFLNAEDFGDMKSAYLERSGEISIIRKK